MFERYTESARRVLFFARMAVTHLGGRVIEPEHVLLGLIREPEGGAAQILERSQVSLPSLREETEAKAAAGERAPTSAEIPFSAATRRVLQLAADEADGLAHRGIGTEHLILGLLREEHSSSPSILTSRGLRLNEVRNWLVQPRAEPSVEPPTAPVMTHGDAINQIDDIKRGVVQLVNMPRGGRDAYTLAETLGDRLEELKRHLRGAL